MTAEAAQRIVVTFVWVTRQVEFSSVRSNPKWRKAPRALERSGITDRKYHEACNELGR